MRLKIILTVMLLVIMVPQFVLGNGSQFQYLWGGYSTSLKLRSQEQRYNSSLAAADLDQMIIPPGGVFSFNQRVGARDSAKGYQSAPFITTTGQLQDTPGGGICQLASTIYNAGLLAGMEVLERHQHSRTVGHIPPGRDATISSWRKDLRLRNPHQYPLQLRIVVDNNRVTSSFYGMTDKTFTVELQVNRTKLRPETIVLDKADTELQQPGESGFSTETRRVIIKDGEIRTELISQDLYPAPSQVLAGD